MAQLRGAESDAEFVRRIRAGDEGAFACLVRRHFRAAFAVALAICGNRMDAEDVCQEAFVRSLERIDSCRFPDRFSAWLFQIVRNQALNCLERLRVRGTEPLEEADRTEASAPESQHERRELCRLLEGALAQLSRTQREVVLLHDLDGWTHRDIATALGISEVMSRQHLFTAHKTLRALLAPSTLKE
jgi:RNA polymerase sigma-70 factor (ECF subfamily)